MSLMCESRFALSLLQQFEVDESVIISPASIALGLALIHSGAEGKSKEEIRQALANESSDDDLLDHYKTMNAGLLNAKNVKVKIASRLFVRDSFEIKQTYIEWTQAQFGALAETLDFNDAATASKMINKFVRETTEKMICQVVEPQLFTRLTMSVLINALYLEAKWEDPFKIASISIDKFHTKKGVKKIQFLNAKEVHRSYTETRKVQVLTLDYRDHDYQFTIVLPKKRYGLKAVRASLTAETLQKLFSEAKETYVNVKIPKFKIENEVSAKTLLEKLGVSEIFTNAAQLHKISSELRLSEVKHKAKIEVDHWGTKAASATAIDMNLKTFCLGDIVRKKPIQFKADHPFLFFVTYKKSILFSGQFIAAASFRCASDSDDESDRKCSLC